MSGTFRLEKQTPPERGCPSGRRRAPPHGPPSPPASHCRRPAVQGPASTDRPRGHLEAIVSPPPGDASFPPEEETKPWKRDADLAPQNRHSGPRSAGGEATAGGLTGRARDPEAGEDPALGGEASVPPSRPRPPARPKPPCPAREAPFPRPADLARSDPRTRGLDSFLRDQGPRVPRLPLGFGLWLTRPQPPGVSFLYKLLQLSPLWKHTRTVANPC